jgi:hypothetical protein
MGLDDAQAGEIIERCPRAAGSSRSRVVAADRARRREVGGREYSISAVGPGPRASKHWALAGRRAQDSAKVQVGASGSSARLPYLPTLDLVAEHASATSRRRA